MRAFHRPRPFADPRGIHHLGVPTDRTSTQPFRKPTESSGTVKVLEAPAVPEVPVLSAPVPEIPAVPAPLVTEVWLNRNILVGLRRDYARDGLPVFRAAVGDRYRLHELAMRAPRTITGGKS